MNEPGRGGNLTPGPDHSDPMEIAMTDVHSSTGANTRPLSLNHRRGFLRQLCALPLIGGGVTLIGQPTAVATPVTRELLEGYDCWLDCERRFLAWERAQGDPQMFETLMNVRWHSHSASAFVHDDPAPSARAALVLSAVGVPLMGGVRG